MSKENFKLFVKNNPRLLRYIENKEMTWQKFYELYDMYGEDNEVWKKYLTDSAGVSFGVNDIVSYFKNINLDNVQESINSIQRVLGAIGDLTGNSVKTSIKNNNYEPKPIYQHLDD